MREAHRERPFDALFLHILALKGRERECVRERDRETESVRWITRKKDRKKERERESVCVRERRTHRERERERERASM